MIVSIVWRHAHNAMASINQVCGRIFVQCTEDKYMTVSSRMRVALLTLSRRGREETARNYDPTGTAHTFMHGRPGEDINDESIIWSDAHPTFTGVSGIPSAK